MSLKFDEQDGVLLITLNRPEAANTLNTEVISGLGQALTDAEHNDAIRVIVLTGAGDRVFCAGMDLKEFSSDGAPDVEGPGLEVFQQRLYPKPMIAALNGTAVAGGFELALACDLIVAAEHAKVGLPEVKRGLFAAGGGTRLPQRIPLSLALELGLLGDPVSARRALEVGLVNRVVEGSQVLEEALLLARKIAQNGPLGVAATKRLMYEAVPDTDWADIDRTARTVFASEDAREGARAFVEKRPAVWTGR
ncbi:enoyl-CoA hydratase-related protein [Streptomyces sp. NPDC096311]|uniref:enoyl-CoA hydratase-related protein n=1 Tax=Streptomyces sp. NPDC096311 TaxID=3366083 RepID=UPI0037FC7878